MKYKFCRIFFSLVAGAVLGLAPSVQGHDSRWAGVINPSDNTESAAAAEQEPGYGKSTGLVGIVTIENAQLTVWNKGDEAVLTRLQFVDRQGNVLLLRDVVIQPNKAATIKFGGSSNRLELQAQFGTNEKRSIGLLVPTFQVTDNQTGANKWIIGQDGFAEFRPVWTPPLVSPM